MIALWSIALAGTGALEITNGDAPGEILVDGIPTGVTAPGRVRGVGEGLRHVTLTYGCHTGSARVDVLAGQVARFEIPLQEAAGNGWIELADVPRGTRATLDGEPLTQQTALPCGAHWLTVETPGYDRFEQLVLIEPGQLAVIRPSLVRVRLSAELDDTPPPETASVSWQRPAIAGGFAALAIGSASAALSWRAHATRAEASAALLIDDDPWDPAVPLIYAVDVDPYRARAAAGWVVTGLAAAGVAASFVF